MIINVSLAVRSVRVRRDLLALLFSSNTMNLKITKQGRKTYVYV